VCSKDAAAACWLQAQLQKLTGPRPLPAKLTLGVADDQAGSIELVLQLCARSGHASPLAALLHLEAHVIKVLHAVPWGGCLLVCVLLLCVE
jgi:hypothetical protein